MGLPLSKNHRELQFYDRLFSIFGLVIVVILIILASPSWGNSSGSVAQQARDLFDMSIEDLLNVEVTSVSKKEQKISEAAAAIFVITQEDIRRSGVTSIPEALRMVPGLQVAKMDANKWAITSRGFNGFFANKLLVLIDGRSVYTPLFSGVFWDVQDYPLQDIERIEVIRGPGATMWGANAVNGVINILTKEAKDTQGTFAEAGLGSEERGFGTVRHGGNPKENLHYRFYGKYFTKDEAVYASGDDAHDDWRVLRGGFRMDYEQKNSDFLTIQGDIYKGKVGETVITSAPPPVYTQSITDDAKVSGGNVLFRWKHVFYHASEMTLQTYYDRTDRDDPMVEEERDTFDIDFQHQFLLGARHTIVWGIGYRYTQDDINNTFTVLFDPEDRQDDLISAFAQDDITITNQIRLTLGTKFEYNDYTGFEIQPNIRLLFKPHDRHSIWTSVSRAVRTPSRSEQDIRVNHMVLSGSPPMIVSIYGDEDYKSEDLLAVELGYRVLAPEFISMDISFFYNIYDNLRTTEPRALFMEDSPSPPHLVLPLVFDNKMDGHSYGVELAADWRKWSWLTLKFAYTYYELELHKDSDSADPATETDEGDIPHHQMSLRSFVNITNDLELDLWSRYVDNIAVQHVDSYVSLDIRIAWRPLTDLEVTLVGQNLLDSHRLEFNQLTFLSGATSEVERGIYGKITWQF